MEEIKILRNGVLETKHSENYDVTDKFDLDGSHECFLCGKKFFCAEMINKHYLHVHMVWTNKSNSINTKKSASNKCDDDIDSCLTINIPNYELLSELGFPSKVGYFCHICDNNIESYSLYYMHMQDFHFQAKQFKCAITLCEKTFASPTKFQEHVKFHNQDLKYNCDLCDATFESENDLKMHSFSTEHENRYKEMQEKCFPARLEARNHQCKMCHAWFGMSHLYIQHMETDNHDYKCQKCGLKFYTPDSRSLHIKQVHPEMATTCEQYDYPVALQSVCANPAHDMSEPVSAGQPGMCQRSGGMPSGSQHHHQPTMTGPTPSPQPSPIVNPSQQLNRAHVAIPEHDYPAVLQSVSANPAHDMSEQVSAGQPEMCQRSGGMPSGSHHHHQPKMTGPAPSPLPSPIVNPSQQLNRAHVAIPQYDYPAALQSACANPAHDMSEQVSAGQPGMCQRSGGMPSGSQHHHQPTMTGPAPSPQPSPIVNPSQQLNRAHVAIPVFTGNKEHFQKEHLRKKLKIQNQQQNDHSVTSENVESDMPSAHSSTSVKIKIRKRISSSKEHNDFKLFKTSSSSKPSSSFAIKEKSPIKIEKVSGIAPIARSSVQVSDFQHCKSKKNEMNNTIVNGSNSLLSKGTQDFFPKVSESTLNEIPNDINSVKICHTKENNIKEKKSMMNKLKTECVELGDLLNTLPIKSGVLLKTCQASFFNFKCPKCNKLFKYLSAASKHLISCKEKFNKNVLIRCSEVIYVCTVCRYNSTLKSDLTSHKCDSDSCVTQAQRDHNPSSSQKCKNKISHSEFEKKPCTKYQNDEIIQQKENSAQSENSLRPSTSQRNSFVQSDLNINATTVYPNPFSPMSQRNNNVQQKLNIKTMRNPFSSAVSTSYQARTSNSKTSSDTDFEMSSTKYQNDEIIQEKENSAQSTSQSSFSQSDLNINAITVYPNPFSPMSQRNNVQQELNIKAVRNPFSSAVSSSYQAHASNSKTSDSETSCTKYQNDEIIQQKENSAQSISQRNNFVQSDLNINAITEYPNPFSSLFQSNNNVQQELNIETMGNLFSTAASTSYQACTSNSEMSLSTDTSVTSNENAANNICCSPELSSDVNMEDKDILASNSEPSTSHNIKFSSGVNWGNKKNLSPQEKAHIEEVANYVADHCKKLLQTLKPSTEKTVDSNDENPAENINLNDSPSNSELVLDTLHLGALPSDEDPSDEDSFEPRVIQRGNFTLTIFQNYCVVYFEGCSMRVSGTVQNFLKDFNSIELQDLLIDLFSKLKQAAENYENVDILEEVIEIISQTDINVDAEFHSAQLHIHTSFETAVEYHGYIIRQSQLCMCAECDSESSLSNIIKHLMEVHDQRNIYISVVP